MICPDCKGTKVYVGLNRVEPCRPCGGTGEVPGVAHEDEIGAGLKAWLKRDPTVPFGCPNGAHLKGIFYDDCICDYCRDARYRSGLPNVAIDPPTYKNLYCPDEAAVRGCLPRPGYGPRRSLR